MNNYGSDKPDTRFEMTLQDLTDLVRNIDFKVFSQAPAVKAIVAKNAANSYSRKAIDKLTRSEEHTSELQSHLNLVCRLLLEKNFFNDTATTEIYTLSLHDALPIFFCHQDF